MAQYNNEHLTGAQLSAYLDKELTSEELPLCATHLSTCQFCQAKLADLRLTAALLRGLPQVEVPRSFVLPANIAVLPQAPARRAQPQQQILKSTFRALSTLAAILGLLFILVGVVSGLPFGRSANSAAGSAPSALSQSPYGRSTLASASSAQNHASPSTRQSPQNGAGTSAPTSTQPPGLTPTPTSNIASHTLEPAQLPAVLDLSQPAGRLAVGALLLILGLFGMILTRRTVSHNPGH